MSGQVQINASAIIGINQAMSNTSSELLGDDTTDDTATTAM
jgi:hypothetical protein